MRFLLASGISLYGDWLTTVALLVLLYRSTGSATAPALYMLVRVAPRVVGPAPGGVLSDRFGPVRLAVACLLVQGVFTGAIVLTTGAGLVWTVYPLVGAAQFVNSVSRPAYTAIPPMLTDSANLARLNGLYAGLFASSILVSPAIGALVLPHTTPQALIAADAASFLLSAVLIVMLPLRGPVRGDDHTPGGFRAGWTAISGEATLRSAAAAAFGNAAVITALQAVLVVAAADHFRRDLDIGWLYAAVGAGGVVGGVLFLRPTPRVIRRREVVALAAGEVLPVIAFVFTQSFALAIALLFASALAATSYEVLAAVAIQQRVPSGLLGRAGGATRMAQYSGMLIGAVASVALVRPLGWEATVVLVCVFAILVLGGFSVTGPRDQVAAAPVPSTEPPPPEPLLFTPDTWPAPDQTTSSSSAARLPPAT